MAMPRSNGTPASMAVRNAVHGARSISASTNRRWRSAPSRVHWRLIDVYVDGPKEPVDGSSVGDASMLPERLSQIPADVEIGTVTADGACDTRQCHDAVAHRGAHAFGHSLGPVAFMPSLPPHKNASTWKPSTAGAIARNAALRASKDPGRAIWRKWRGYHRRSRAVTTRHCAKLPGRSLVARDFDRQVAEPRARAAVLDGCTALRIPIVEPAGQVRLGKGEVRTSRALRNKAPWRRTRPGIGT